MNIKLFQMKYLYYNSCFFSTDRNYTCQPFIGKCGKYLNNDFPRICKSFIYFLAVMHLLKEVSLNCFILYFHTMKSYSFSFYEILNCYQEL